MPFELDRQRIPEGHAVDLIEKAIGVYQSNRTAALRRTINPFWWLKGSLLWFLSIPFIVLGALGFNATHTEGSVFGQSFKLLLAISALLTIVNYLGWLPAALSLIGGE